MIEPGKKIERKAANTGERNEGGVKRYALDLGKWNLTLIYKNSLTGLKQQPLRMNCLSDCTQSS